MIDGTANKTDARSLDADAQAHLRRSAVQAVRGGMSQTEAARVFGVSVKAVNNWMARDKAGGLRVIFRRNGARDFRHIGATRLSA